MENPVQVLEDHDEGLLAGLPQQQALHGVECAQAALPRVEHPPRGIVDRDIQEGQQRRQRGLERAVEGDQLAGDLLADLAELLAVLDPEVAL
jgi:hypothetical protein